MALLGEVLPEARPRPPSPAWNQISVEMQRTLFPAYNGDADPRAAAAIDPQAAGEIPSTKGALGG